MKLLVCCVILSLLVAFGESKSLKKKRSIVNAGKILNNFSLEPALRVKRDASYESADISVDAEKIDKYKVESWEEGNILTEFLNELSGSNVNVTLVGWQQLFHPDGREEFVEISLVLPPRPDKVEENVVDNEEDDSDENDIDENFYRWVPHDFVNKLRDILDPLYEVGFSAVAFFEEYNKEGEPEVLIYIDKNILYSYTDGFIIFNNTQIVTQDFVDSFSKQVESYDTVSILKYDEDMNLKESSKISPHLLGSVNGGLDIPDDMFLEAPQIMAKLWAKYPREEIPVQLATAFNNRWNRYLWRVLVDTEMDSIWVSRDIIVNLNVDNLDLDDTDLYLNYLVYGSEK